MSEKLPNQTRIFSCFADWCRNKDDLSPQARHTVEQLLREADTSDCEEAERRLSSRTTLDLSWRQISDISPLASLPGLSGLALYDNDISDIRPLAHLTQLTQLVLSDNQISDISPLARLTGLRELNLCNNQISDIKPLLALTQLNKLLLSTNQISDISPLSSLTQLTQLILSANQISDISPLSSLTQLKELDIIGNQISDISCLSALTQLSNLGLSSNKICDISVLSALTQLKSLTLFNNQIEDIRPLSALTQLKELFLFGNLIDISPSATLQRKWQTVCSQPIKPHHATTAVNAAYAVLGHAAPKVICCPSPYAALVLLSNVSETGGENKGEPLPLFQQLSNSIRNGLSWGLWVFLGGEMDFPGEWNLVRQIREQLENQLQTDFDEESLIVPENLVQLIKLSENRVANCGWVPNQKTQEVLRCLYQLLEHCGWIFAFEKVCIVCDRPIKLSFDAQDRFHAEGEPAIQFCDGWNTKYYYHGVELPEEYGQLHPSQWSAKWLLQEENAELRRVLIQGIGYSRICQELETEELDTWQEYTLLKINSNIDGFIPNDFEPPQLEPIYLLKMICPSTGFIHAMRVPPDMTSAREAISWINWGIDPEEFAVQT